MGNAVPQNVVARCNRCKGVKGGGNSTSGALLVVVVVDAVEATVEDAYKEGKDIEFELRVRVVAVKADVVTVQKCTAITTRNNAQIRQKCRGH
jgi:hypothetical protein